MDLETTPLFPMTPYAAYPQANSEAEVWKHPLHWDFHPLCFLLIHAS